VNGLVALAAAALAAVAAAGVLRPFGRGRASVLERSADPLEDERDGLLRALRDLDEERADGELEEDAYRALRGETEARAVAVLRALEARDRAGTLVADIRAIRVGGELGAAALGAGGQLGAAAPADPEAARGNGSVVDERQSVRRPRTRARTIAVAAFAGVAIAVTAVLLASALRTRTAGQPITGGIGTSNPLGFFQQRVEDHPNDVAARLDLAQRYQDSGNAQGAIAEYLAALQIDGRNAEAHAELGFILFRAGKPEDGLRAVQQALNVQPDYPLALYYKGFILLRGLNRPADAAEAFRAYLRAAPYGARRAEVVGLLSEAQRQG
jgi:tetratricopeptide (TPR) repeat protein